MRLNQVLIPYLSKLFDGSNLKLDLIIIIHTSEDKLFRHFPPHTHTYIKLKKKTIKPRGEVTIGQDSFFYSL
jgi:hypothetical protein